MGTFAKTLSSLLTVKSTQQWYAVSEARAMRLAKAKAADRGIAITKDRAGGWWVTYEPVLDDPVLDPLEGNHFCASGSEVLYAVEAYADAIDLKQAQTFAGTLSARQPGALRGGR